MREKQRNRNETLLDTGFTDVRAEVHSFRRPLLHRIFIKSLTKTYPVGALSDMPGSGEHGETGCDGKRGSRMTQRWSGVTPAERIARIAMGVVVCRSSRVIARRIRG
ncbi:hypothetical protein Rwratislav_21723 [Rhodococcus wratislaviensis IFP 2016]|nr:hypothetical protein Rwratislav_21723 [Rhodococcus wratislaviensis IFP 2016]